MLIGIYYGVKLILSVLIAFGWLHEQESTLKIASALMLHDAILIGSLFGKLYHQYKNVLVEIVTGKIFLLATIMIYVLLYYLSLKYAANKYGLITVLFAICYGVMLLNAAFSRVFEFLNNPVIDYFGKISYGIYMYHSIFVALGLYIMRYLGFNESGIVYNVCLYTLVITSTIAFSSFSYRYFELPFIRMKKKFMKINSSN